MADKHASHVEGCAQYRVSSVSFLAYTGFQVKRNSCCCVTNVETFDNLLHPTTGGLYDSALGPTEQYGQCTTCGLSANQCPGHFGHISVPLPLYHPLYFSTVYQLLRCTCWCCHQLLATRPKVHLLRGQLLLLERGLISQISELDFVCNDSFGEVISTEAQSTHTCKPVISAIDEFVSKCMVNDGDNDQTVINVKSKHVWELKHQLVSHFFKECAMSKCPNCSAPVRPIRQEYRAKFFMKPLSQKLASTYASIWFKNHTSHLPEQTVVSEYASNDAIFEDCLKQKYVTPLEARNHLRAVFANECSVLDFVFGKRNNEENLTSRADVFFLDVLVVPPSRFRPISTLGDKKFENPQTANLQKVLQDCLTIHDLIKRRGMKDTVEVSQPKGTSTFAEQLHSAWVRLQIDVNCFVDSDSDKLRGKDAPSGIRQILEKKEGLFRKHMMGKRVNFAARSVISPDPYINMDEVGVPMVFATKLTYPESVTPWNAEELSKAVINGPLKHPGATHVEYEDGSTVILSRDNLSQRQGIARRLLTPTFGMKSKWGTKKVYRHLKNGDVLLMNRQPTLHKPSIMAHKARVLPGERTLRMHYANCKTYNADFDGDEMNAHFPQNELAKSEALCIVSTHNQYLVPKDGTPLSGLIQDHVVSGVVMTTMDCAFDRTMYQQLLYAALPDSKSVMKVLPPAYIKPKHLWSGKQLLSTVVLNVIPYGQYMINLISKAKVSSKEWTKALPKGIGKVTQNSEDPYMLEDHVVFRNGEFLCGILDKSQFGPSEFGLVHACHELYGGIVANQLLSALGRLFTGFLQLCHGFTLGIEDILVTSEADAKRQNTIVQSSLLGKEAAAEAFGVLDANDAATIVEKYTIAHHSGLDQDMKLLDYCVKKRVDKATNEINKICMGSGLHRPFPKNCLQVMVLSGAKGSSVNCMQISCLLGQIELEGQRPPLMPSGRSLPSFHPYDLSPRARGFVSGRFLTGIKPQEYFIHCMAGREGLVDTAVKTSRSGYLQRCLIKHLEGICVQYDQTVRDSDGSVIQFLYGEDGMDIFKTRYLSPKQYPFLASNYQVMLSRLDPSAAEDKLHYGRALKCQNKIEKWKKKHPGATKEPAARNSGFLVYYQKHLQKYGTFQGSRIEGHYGRSQAVVDVIADWYKLDARQKSKFNRQALSCPDPVISYCRSDQCFGALSEKILDDINLYSDSCDLLRHKGTADDKKVSLTLEKFNLLFKFKCLRAVCDPGEAVGLLAAQSIGEPSTQMTLNTFHFAGRGEMNVTLGIPRLREILMTASSSIKTPSMSVPLLHTQHAIESGHALKKLFTKVSLAEVLDKIELWESEGRLTSSLSRTHCYKIRFTLLPQHMYMDMFVVTPETVISHIEKLFLKRLISVVLKTIKTIRERRYQSVVVEEAKNQFSDTKDDDSIDDAAEECGTRGDDEIDDNILSDAEGNEEDGTVYRQQQQQLSYEAPDHDEEEIKRDIDGLVSSDVEEIQQEEECNVSTLLMGDDFTPDQDRVSEVECSSVHVVKYTYDAKESLWCEVMLQFPLLESKLLLNKLIKTLAEKSVVSEIAGIRRCFLIEDASTGQMKLKTEGINIPVLWEHPKVFDLERIHCNDIHYIAGIYGIEAANKVIIKEIQDVFSVYGITVDYHHLSVIADYMTFEGSYKPFNRIGIESSCSPFQKMSFETTMHFLRSAAMYGDTDHIQSPSACLVTGQVIGGGTGTFELLQPVI